MYTKKQKHNNKTKKTKTKTKTKTPPWGQWSKLAPNQSQRKEMLYKCGKKCFLGPQLSFPICAKGTCKINKKGVWAAYIRAAQWEKKRGHIKGALPYEKVKKSIKKLLK